MAFGNFFRSLPACFVSGLRQRTAAAAASSSPTGNADKTAIAIPKDRLSGVRPGLAKKVVFGSLPPPKY